MVVACLEDMEQFPEFVFPEPLADKIAQTDFKESFLLLVCRGHPNRGLVKAITRRTDRDRDDTAVPAQKRDSLRASWLFLLVLHFCVLICTDGAVMEVLDRLTDMGVDE